MSTLKRYNSSTGQWETAIVGKQGPAGITIQSSTPSSTNVLWANTSDAGDMVVPSGGTTGQILVKNSNTDYDTTWVTGGLRWIKTVNVGSAVSSVKVTNVFSSLYNNYQIIIDNIVGSITYQTNILMQLGSASTNHYGGAYIIDYNGFTAHLTSSNSNRSFIGQLFVDVGSIVNINILNPFATANTVWSGTHAEGGRGGYLYGLHNLATSFTDFTISTQAGTMTGGKIIVYGVPQ